MIRKTWIIALLLTATLGVKAQEQLPPIIKGGCTPELEADADDGVAAARAARRVLPAVKTNWDPDKTYRQAVILVEFQNMAFRAEHPRETYDSIFNYPGYNGGVGPGCVAEYFQEQSGGLFNPQFDVFGPYKVPGKARLNEKATKDTKEYGTYQMAQAVEMWVNEDKARDHSVYDWDGNRSIDQVIFVFAGYAGNAGVDSLYGYLWPHTGEKFAVSSVVTYDDYTIAQCSASCEMRTSKTSWGFGTICHEYTHALGLPDIYPVGSSNAGYSVVDEWDLMDGGNYTNNGQCPPCLSGMERMLLGWQTPIELSEPTTITDMKPLSEGGPVYMVRHTDKEYYLLENRQWTGWDAGLPGKGLIVVHVDYDAGKWSSNHVNETRNHRRYQLVPADNRDYDAWDEYLIKQRDQGLITSQYLYSHRMNNFYMSEAAYPWKDKETGTVNDMLTDSSKPRSAMFNRNSSGSTFLSKSITNIRVSEEGLVSFDFMGGDQTGIDELVHKENRPLCVVSVYDMGGRCLGSHLESQRPGIYILRYSDGTTKKVVKK